MKSQIVSRQAVDLVYVGMDTPWGKADSAALLADGIGSVCTPSHGGIRLSDERQALLPAAVRQSGWYEEDCDWAIPLVAFAHDLAAANEHADLVNRECAVRSLAAAPQILRDWNPSAYAALTGETPTAANSFKLAERQFLTETRNRYVVRAARGEGELVRCIARRAADRDERVHIMPAALYQGRGRFGFVIDECDVSQRWHPELPLNLL